jgi:hypothetical protein
MPLAIEAPCGPYQRNLRYAAANCDEYTRCFSLKWGFKVINTGWLKHVAKTVVL